MSSRNGRYKVYKVKQTYPENWNTIKKDVTKRDMKRCFYCHLTETQLKKLGRWLERHHLFSVRTGNNRKTNVVTACNECHGKQPKHRHLLGRSVLPETKKNNRITRTTKKPWNR